MSVKKNKALPKDTVEKKAKKTIKKIKAEKAEKKVKAEIKKAVEQIPGMIIENYTFPAKAVSQNNSAENLSFENPYTLKENITPKETIMSEYQSLKKKKKLLWMGVIAFALAIFVLWGWNAYVLVGDINGFRAKNQSIFDKANNDFKNIITETNQPTSLENALDKQTKNNDANAAKEDLQKTLAGLLAVSSTVSSPATSVTTTPQVFPTSTNKLKK